MKFWKNDLVDYVNPQDMTGTLFYQHPNIERQSHCQRSLNAGGNARRNAAKNFVHRADNEQ